MSRELQPDLRNETDGTTRVAQRGGEGETALKIGSFAGLMLSAEMLLTGNAVVDAHDLVEDEGMDTAATTTATTATTEAHTHQNQIIDEGMDPTATATPRPDTGAIRSRSRVAEVRQGVVLGGDLAESAQVAQIDPTPTPLPELPVTSPTPDATPTPTEPVEIAQVPSATPTVGLTEVAALPAESLSTMLSGFPSSIDMQLAMIGPTHIELNLNTLRPIIGTDGRIVAPGYYGDRPLNLGATFMGSATSVEGDASSINGIPADYDYIVGYLVNVTNNNGARAFYIGFPDVERDANGRVINENSADKHWSVVGCGPYGAGNRIYAINENGQVLPTATNAEGGSYAIGNDTSTNLVVGTDNSFTFPTVDGVQRLRAGDPFIMTIIRNSADMGRARENQGHTNDEVIASLMDDNPANDITWGDGVSVPLLPHMFLYAMSSH